MRSLNRTETAAFLRTHDRYCILTHRGPDGDTLGSAAALCLGLRQLGKAAWILENPEITEKYQDLHKGLTIPQAETDHTLICVDVAAAHMLPDSFSHLADKLTLRLDHHGGRDCFSQLQLVDDTAAACGQIIYDLLMLLGCSLDRQMAEAIYIAISTDTGCFRYANTQSSTFQVAAACAAVHPELYRINQRLFDTNSLARLKLQSWLIEHAQFLYDGRIAICALPLATERELGLTEDDMENISGFPRSIQGVKISAMLREGKDGAIKLSVRAVPGYNAAAICEKFGGGGHAGAAGAGLSLPMEEAVAAVIAAMPDLNHEGCIV